MNVVLVGYRGTGKSSVAEVLGRSLGLDVVNLDSEIARKAGKSIPEIVEEGGWETFRNLEEDVCRTYAVMDDLLIDCGGGVVERENNFEVLRSAGPVVWLKASPETIVERIKGDDQRPSLTGDKSFTEEAAEVLERRTPLYKRIAHLEVDTEERTVRETASEIVRLLKSGLPA